MLPIPDAVTGPALAAAMPVSEREMTGNKDTQRLFPPRPRTLRNYLSAGQSAAAAASRSGGLATKRPPQDGPCARAQKRQAPLDSLSGLPCHWSSLRDLHIADKSRETGAGCKHTHTCTSQRLDVHCAPLTMASLQSFVRLLLFFWHSVSFT